MMVHKINSSVDYNKWLKLLDTRLNEPTNQKSIKVTKAVKHMNKKTLLDKTLGTSVITAQCPIPPWYS